jgi:hypothetical protein
MTHHLPFIIKGHTIENDREFLTLFLTTRVVAATEELAEDREEDIEALRNLTFPRDGPASGLEAVLGLAELTDRTAPDHPHRLGEVENLLVRAGARREFKEEVVLELCVGVGVERRAVEVLGALDVPVAEEGAVKGTGVNAMLFFFVKVLKGRNWALVRRNRDQERRG